MAIANGNHKNTIKEMIENQNCTWFFPKVSKLDARKQWIIGSVAPKGEVIIDQGAVKAINNGKSLLPAGIKKINGIFEKGDHILVKDQNDFECARGLTSFSSIEIENTIAKHPSVSLAAVVAKPDEKWGETPCAFVELIDGKKATEEEIIKFCRETLAGFKLPKKVVFSPLPKTSTGKIQKFELRKKAKELT